MNSPLAAGAPAQLTPVVPAFKEFPKMPRFSRGCVITEKIDGTNACVCITEDGQFLTGSRTRWITPTDDNFGFSRWAHEHEAELRGLGVGTHFGEWWGSGVQRGYNLPKGENRFSLFNAGRWRTADQPAAHADHAVCPPCCSVVPVLYSGPFESSAVTAALEALRALGSVAAPGFMRPEGLVVYHTASGTYFKKTIEKDEVPKSLA